MIQIRDSPSYFVHFGELYFLLFIMRISITRYNAMIFEALSTSKDQNGLDTSTIASFIEVLLEVTFFLYLIVCE